MTALDETALSTTPFGLFNVIVVAVLAVQVNVPLLFGLAHPVTTIVEFK